MSKMDVTLINDQDGEAWPAEVIPDKPVGTWISQWLAALGLPREEKGKLLAYALIIERTGKTVNEADRLDSFDLEAGETLRLVLASQPQPKIASKKSPWRVVGILAGILLAAGLGILIFLLLTGQINLPAAVIGKSAATPTPELPATASPQATLTLTATVRPTGTATATLTHTPTFTNTPTITLTPTPEKPPALAEVGEEWIRRVDQSLMVFVPGGTFGMGSTPNEITSIVRLCMLDYGYCTRYQFDDQTPVHDVKLHSFWMDAYEITNTQFAYFLNEADHQLNPKSWREWDDQNNYLVESAGKYGSKTGYADHPVMVPWEGASAYCEWFGGRLPNEAEWEYAARGPDRNLYPWGNTLGIGRSQEIAQLNFCDVNCPDANFKIWGIPEYDDGYQLTAPVGSYPLGKSWVGIYDMAGNAPEWVFDYYGPEYYANSPFENPIGPESGNERVVRGGSFYASRYYARSDYRSYSSVDSFRGFRCLLTQNKE